MLPAEKKLLYGNIYVILWLSMIKHSVVYKILIYWNIMGNLYVLLWLSLIKHVVIQYTNILKYNGNT